MDLDKLSVRTEHTGLVLSLAFIVCTLCANVLLTVLIGQLVSCQSSLSSVPPPYKAGRILWISRLLPSTDEQQFTIDSPSPVSDKHLRRLVAIV